MSNHTKGPWEYSTRYPKDKGFTIVADHTNHGATIATVHIEMGMSHEEAEANAQLIAQAPRLYKDLESANKQLGEALGKVADLEAQMARLNRHLTIATSTLNTLKQFPSIAQYIEAMEHTASLIDNNLSMPPL